MSNENKTRIYGIDPGSIKDVDDFNSLDEIDLWMNIDALGFYLWYCNHEMSDGRMDYVDLTEEQYAMEYMVYQTKKFGVELGEPEEGKHIEQSDSYMAWYQFYSNHFKNVLSKEDFNKFVLAKKNNEDITSYLPEGSWKDSMGKSKVLK